MKASEVLDYKADLMLKLHHPAILRMWIYQIAKDTKVAVQFGRSQMGQISDETAERNAGLSLLNLRNQLPTAEAYHVNNDMSTLVTFSASRLDQDDRFNIESAPSDAGLVRFDGGLPFEDVRGKKLTISWMAWLPVETVDAGTGQRKRALQLFLWNDHREEPDDIYREMVGKEGDRWPEVDRTIGRWGFIGAEMIYAGDHLGPAMVDPGEERAAEILAAGATPQAFSNSKRLLYALWLMLGQTITATSSEPIPKPTRKRAERAKIPPRVTVIYLRRKETRRTEGESKVEWSHRWVVKGDWRWRRCGKDHPLAQPYPKEMADTAGLYRARVWIDDFVKGPSDKPLVMKDRVYALHR